MYIHTYKHTYTYVYVHITYVLHMLHTYKHTYHTCQPSRVSLDCPGNCLFVPASRFFPQCPGNLMSSRNPTNYCIMCVIWKSRRSYTSTCMAEYSFSSSSSAWQPVEVFITIPQWKQWTVQVLKFCILWFIIMYHYALSKKYKILL